MEQHLEDRRGEKERACRTTSALLANLMRVTSRRLKRTDRIVSAVELEFLGLVMKMTREFLIGCSREVSELKPFWGKVIEGVGWTVLKEL